MPNLAYKTSRCEQLSTALPTRRIKALPSTPVAPSGKPVKSRSIFAKSSKALETSVGKKARSATKPRQKNQRAITNEPERANGIQTLAPESFRKFDLKQLGQFVVNPTIPTGAAQMNLDVVVEPLSESQLLAYAAKVLHGEQRAIMWMQSIRSELGDCSPSDYIRETGDLDRVHELLVSIDYGFFA